MATFKMLIKPEERKQDGTWNVKIRVYHNRKTRYVATPFWVTQEQLTRNYKLKDSVIIDKVEEEIRNYRNAVVNIGFIADGLDVDHLIELIRNNSHSEKIDFLSFMEGHIKSLEKEGRKGTAYAYRTAYLSLKKYNKNRPLYFSNITSYYMLGYYKSLSGLKINSIRSYITAIKTAYKLAIRYYNDDDLGINIVKRDVFKLIDLPQVIDTNKDSFTKEQIQALIDVPYTGKWIYDFPKDMFILSFMCFGINARDLFFAKKSQYKDGILSYSRQKIVRAGKEADMKIKLSEPAKIILDKYSGDSEYLIDFDGRERSTAICRYIHCAFQNAGIEEKGDYLSKIGHKKGRYVYFINRHTMATLARNECGIDYMTVHQMLNHATPQSLRTTDVYIQRDFSPLWEANEKLLSLFDWSFYLSQKII